MEVFTHSNSYRYIYVLPGLLKGYNSSPHRDIKGRTPDSITEHNTLDVWRESHAQSREQRTKFKFQVGTKVRISRDKQLFEKRYMHNRSEEYFIIMERLSRIPLVYRLKDLNNQQLKGVLYEYQLQKVTPGELYPISKVLTSWNT